MAGNSRDEILKLVFETQGQEGLDQITAALAKAGAQGGESGEALNKAAAELGVLLDRARQVDVLEALQSKLAAVDEKLASARTTLAELNSTEDQSVRSTAEFAASYKAAQNAVEALAAQHASLTVRVSTASAALETAGVDTANLTTAQTDLRLQTESAAAQLTKMAEATRQSASAHQANTEATEKEAFTLSELGEKYQNFGQILETFKGLLLTIGAITTFDKLKDGVEEVVATGDKMQKWQIQLTNLYGSVDAGKEAFEKLEEVAHNTPLTLSQVMEAAINMKRQGLDPLNGTLETLVNANKVYGGTTDQLSGIIESFTREAAKGELSSRLLMQMQLAGIPAATLLGDAMGKTADQIREMAKTGDLGADAMDLLLEQLKKVGENPASKGMTTIQAQVNSVKKSWEEFLELIAKSGLYDYAKQELTEVATALKTALADGEAKEKAQAISDAIVGIGKAAGSIVGFLVDHAGAIKAAAEAYGGLKLAMFAVDLAGMVAKWVPATAATVANTLATQANALAQRELAAAEVAATEAKVAQTVATEAGTASLGASVTSILTTVTSFGSLRAALNGIGGAIAALVGGPWVALLAALGFVAKETYDAGTAIGELSKATEELDRIQKENAATQEALVQKAKAVAQANRDAADVQVKSTQEIAELSKQQAAQYEEQLQSAIKYYTALKIAARGDNNTTLADSYSAKLHDLIVALQATQKQFGELDDSLKESASRTAANIKTVVDQILALRGTEGVPQAISDAFTQLKIETPTGLATFVGVLDQLKSLGPETAQALQSTLVAELQKLNDMQFADFRKNLTDAFDHGKISAQDYRTILQAIAQKDMLALGLSAQQSGEAITAQGAKIIAAFKDISTNAATSGQQIQLSFAQALTKASTSGEIDALKTQLTAAFNAGKISADQFGVAMEAAGRKTAEIKVAAAEAGASLDGVGKAGQTAAQRTAAALDIMRGDLVATANLIATKLADAMKSGADPKYINDLLASAKDVDAQIQDLTGRINNLGAAGDNAGKTIASGMSRASEATREAEQQTESYDAAMATLRDTAATLEDKLKAVSAAMANASNDTEKQAAAAESVETKMHAAAGAAQSLAQVMENSRAEFAGMNGALAEFDRGAKEVAQSSFNLSDYFAGLQSVYNGVKQKVDNATQSLRNQASILDTVGTAGDKFFSGIEHGADDAIAKLGYLKNSLHSVDDGFASPEDIARFNTAMDGAIQRMQALADAERAAKDAFKSMSDQLQDQADQQAGDLAAVEDRRYQKQLADIKDAAEKANELNSAQYQRDVANADAIHAKNMANLRAEAEARANAAKGSSATTSSSGAGVSSYSGATNSSGSGAAGAAPQKIELAITAAGTSASFILDALKKDPFLTGQVAQLLMPSLGVAIQNAIRNAGGRL